MRSSLRVTMWMVTAVCTQAAMLPAVAQDDEAVKTEVITLSHSPSGSVVELLQSVVIDGIDAVHELSQTNQVVLQGYTRGLTVAKQLIERIDVPSPSREVRTELIPVVSYPIEELAKLLSHGPVGETSRIGIDSRNNRLVVTDTDEGLSRTTELVRQLDRPSGSLTAYFYFLRGEFGEGGAPAADIPQALQPIVKTLSANGFARLSMLAPLVVRADDTRQFSSSSTLHVGKDKTGGSAQADLQAQMTFVDQLSFMVQGRTRFGSDSDQVQLELQAKIQGQVGRRQVSFGVETTLGVKLDQYVLLAASPSSTGEADAVALVVRVTRGE